MRHLVLAASLTLVLVGTAYAQPDPCAAQRDQYIGLELAGPPQDKAAYDQLAAALDALFMCHNPGISIHSFGDLDQFFVPPATATPTPTPGP